MSFDYCEHRFECRDCGATHADIPKVPSTPSAKESVKMNDEGRLDMIRKTMRDWPEVMWLMDQLDKHRRARTADTSFDRSKAIKAGMNEHGDLAFIFADGAQWQAAKSVASAITTAPEYEYVKTQGPRKAWDGEPDLTKEGWEELSWDREDYHEERRWRRPVVVPTASSPSEDASEYFCSLDKNIGSWKFFLAGVRWVRLTGKWHTTPPGEYYEGLIDDITKERDALLASHKHEVYTALCEQVKAYREALTYIAEGADAINLDTVAFAACIDMASKTLAKFSDKKDGE